MKANYLTDIDHECKIFTQIDIDICSECGEHSSYCEDCGLNECCGVEESYYD